MTKEEIFELMPKFIGNAVEDTPTNFRGRCTGVCYYEGSETFSVLLERTTESGEHSEFWTNNNRCELIS